jgi:hypothetical protein
VDAKFSVFVEQLHPAFERLVAMRPISNGSFGAAVRHRGVYLFSEPQRGHLYVGRSNDIRGRYGRHCNPGATHRMAAFAFRLAREGTGRVKASYKAGPDSRSGLIANPEFRAAFDSAKARIRSMEFRFVEEADPIKQCLLDIYAAVVLQTPYNDFDNH